MLRIGYERKAFAASFRLARLLEEGKFGRNRMAEAVDVYRQSAQDGSASSRNRLASLLYKGQGVKRNYEGALYWFNEAAKQGNPEAYGSLCTIHFAAKLVPRDDVETYKWCDLAIATLQSEPIKREAVRNMHRLANRMSDAEIDQATAKEEGYPRFNDSN